MLCNIKPVPFHESNKHIFAKIPGGGVRIPGPPLWIRPCNIRLKSVSKGNIFHNTDICRQQQQQQQQQQQNDNNKLRISWMRLFTVCCNSFGQVLLQKQPEFVTLCWYERVADIDCWDKILLKQVLEMLLSEPLASLITFFRTSLIQFYLNSQ